jgi:hypothetical protein
METPGTMDDDVIDTSCNGAMVLVALKDVSV